MTLVEYDWGAVARAIFAGVLTDLHDKRPCIGAEARAWLLDDHTDAGWREILAELGDVSLEGLQRFVRSDPPIGLVRRAARRLRREIT